MIIDVLLEDAKLVHELDQIEIFQVNKINPSQSTQGEVLIISDRMVHHNELYTYSNRNHLKKYYLVSNSYDDQLHKQIKTICDSLNIRMLPPRLTIDQIISDIYEELFPSEEDSSSNIVTMISSIPNVGLTSTTLSLATAIGSLTDAKVGVLGLDAWDDGVDQISQYKGKYLNEIKTQLTNKLLDTDSFLELFHKDEKAPFYYLAGNRNTKMERLFTIEEMDYLISLAKRTFDLVILDAGSHWDNANIIQSLKHADLKLIIMNQQRKSIKKFDLIDQHILLPLGYKRSEFLLVINGYNSDPSLLNEKDIHSELNIPYLTYTPHLDFLGIHSEMTQKILYHYHNEEYNHSINHISRGIISRTNLVMKQEEIIEKAKGRWNILARIGR